VIDTESTKPFEEFDMAKTKVYVYIGRFQPFHNAHAYVMNRAAAIADRVIILVGSAYQARTIKNPFTFGERKGIIDRFMEQHNDTQFNVLPLRDQPYNDPKWIQTVQEQVESALQGFGDNIDDCEITVTGSDRDSSTWYLNAFPQWKLDLIEPVPQGRDLNATGIRKVLFNGGNIDSVKDDLPLLTVSFINRFIGSEWHARLTKQYRVIEAGKEAWADAPYPVIFQTVDCVVIQSGHVLAVERRSEPGEGLWALPGGFLNPEEWLRDAAIRELEEETKIKIPTATLKNAIRAREIFDDPKRSLRGRTITVAHLIRLDDSKPLPKVKGSDDAARAFWIPLHEARKNSDKWFEDHLSILDWAVGVKDRT
jgi:bifunctional NMN adenylyltransferase/nudix hydrolase